MNRYEQESLPRMEMAASTNDPLPSSLPNTLQPLPAELWAEIVILAIRRGADEVRSEEDERWRWSVSRVCKWWKRVALPELYSSPLLPNLATLHWFATHLRETDAPWVIRTLDLSRLPSYLPASQLFQVNSSLQSLWPLLPHLENLILRREWMVSNSVITDLAENCSRLKRVKGLSWTNYKSGQDEALLTLFSRCTLLEEVEVHGKGNAAALPTTHCLSLEHLHTLVLIGVPSAPFLEVLISSPLPALRDLTVTPYHGAPGERITAFLAAHGPKLTSLRFARRPESTSLPIATPPNVLSLCPNLRSLTLVHPLPASLEPPAARSYHPLQSITLPPPTHTAEYTNFLLNIIPYASLRNMEEVRLTDFRWLRQPSRNDSGIRRGLLQPAITLRKKGVEAVDETGAILNLRDI